MKQHSAACASPLAVAGLALLATACGSDSSTSGRPPHPHPQRPAGRRGHDTAPAATEQQ